MVFIDQFQKWVFFFSFSCLFFQYVSAFYLPGSFPHKYVVGDQLSVKVNSLTSVETEIPYGYYTIPVCKPPEGIKDSAENLGELLMGDRIENSPYKFKMYVNQSDLFLCTSNPLSSDEFKNLKERIDEIYQVNLNLDNLPAIRYFSSDGLFLRWTGYPIGSKIQDVYYVFNHLKFTVLVHKYEKSSVAGVIGTGDGAELITTDDDVEPNGNVKGYMVVGFEVVPCSFQHNPKLVKDLKIYSTYPSPIKCDPTSAVAMPVKEGQPLTFSYEVSFVESDIRWPSRWDAYLKMEGSKVHWFSILNSVMVIMFLAGIVLIIFLRTIRRDLARYEEIDNEAAQINEELSGWKLVVGDVFRPPPNSEFLCLVVADGCRILGMAITTIFFAALGFMSPASRGALLTGMLFFYMFLGILAGYVGVWLFKTIRSGDSSGWFSIAWRISIFFPGIAFLILTTLNFLLWGSHSTGAIPFSTFIVLLLLWFCISVPLTLIGGFIGTKSHEIEYPTRTNQIPREIPTGQILLPSWLLVLGAGTLPFGTLFIELFFILSSIWLGRVYYVFGFLLIVMFLLVVVCAEVSVVLTYMHLCVEDWQWWWKSFFASGSVSIYIFMYSVNYLVFDLKSLSGPVSAILYLGYSLLMAIAVMLATGAIGFLSSLLFVHRLFSSVKID